jgi:hypothetical protein
MLGYVDGDLFIALDMIELDGAEEERAIRAYVCDGADVSVWMTGQFSGDEVTLVSGDTRIVLTSINSVSGTVSLAGGAEVPFTATWLLVRPGCIAPRVPSRARIT